MAKKKEKKKDKKDYDMTSESDRRRESKIKNPSRENVEFGKDLFGRGL